jgi:arsenate reductase
MTASTRLHFSHELFRPREDLLQSGTLVQASGAQTMQALIGRYLGVASQQAGTILTPRVLFLCTANSARSQMAEALLRKHAGGHFEVYSAGIQPGEMNRLALRVLDEIGIDASGQWAKSVDLFRGRMHFDYVVTLCGDAEKRCPVFPAATVRLHWPFEDPAAASGSGEERLVAFRAARDEIEKRILAWLQEVQ